jgi:hypothetical protein
MYIIRFGGKPWEVGSLQYLPEDLSLKAKEQIQSIINAVHVKAKKPMQ